MQARAPELIARYLRAVTDGDSAAFGDLLDPDMVFEEQPSRIAPNGGQRRLPEMRAGLARSREILRAQTYDMRSSLVSDERVVLEVVWTGTLAEPIGSIPAGGQMRAQCAMFFDLRDGRIVRQRNYDCYEPF